jgi:tetratricopeptide (TPR) repeat protein
MATDAGVPSSARRVPLNFSINIEGGVGSLALQGRSLSRVGRVERMRMIVPGLRFPFDLSGGASGFRNRRCDLHLYEVSFGGAELRRTLRALDLSRFGLSHAGVDLQGTDIVFHATAALGDNTVDFSAVGAIRMTESGRLRISFHDLRVYGFFPVPAPILVSTFLSAVASMGGVAVPGKEASVDRRRPIQLNGPSELEVDVLDWSLFDLLAQRGWRLPARSHLRSLEPEGEPDRIVLRYVARDGKGEPGSEFALSESSNRSGTLHSYEEGRVAFPKAEAALVEGDVTLAVARYREAMAMNPGSAFATTRLLQLLVASKETLQEAEELASSVLARSPRDVTALLVRAAAVGQRQRHAEAAEMFRLVAEQGSPLPSPDTASALVAAAAAHLTVGQFDAARDLLEQIRLHCPGHASGLDLLRRCYRSEKRFADWLSVLRQRELDESEPRQKATLLSEMARVLLEDMNDPAQAGARFAEAIILDETLASTWEGLALAQFRSTESGSAGTTYAHALSLYQTAGDLAGARRVLIALGDLAEKNGDATAADVRYAEAEQTTGPTPELARRRARVLETLGRYEQATASMQIAVDAVADGPEAAELRVELAALLARQPGQMGRARLELEHVLQINPSNAAALTLLAQLADDAGAADLLPMFRRAIERSEGGPGLRTILEVAHRVAVRADRAGFVLNALMATARAATRAGAEAAKQLGLLALEGREFSPDEKAIPDVERILDRHLATPVIAQDPLRAELAQLVGNLRERSGDEEGALSALEFALKCDARADVAISVWRRVVELKARRGDAGGAARALMASADDPRTAQSAPARAALLVAAAEIMRERLRLPEDALPLLERATILDPLNNKAFDALETAAEAAKDWERLAQVIGRRAEKARLTERRNQLGRMARILIDKLGRPEEAALAFERALEIDPEFVPALLWLARWRWQGGESEASITMYRRLASIGTTISATGGPSLENYSEAHLRMAQIARVIGQIGESENHLERGVANEPVAGAPVEILVDALESLGELDLLAELLRARTAAAQSTLDRQHLEVVLARVLEQSGHSSEAVSIYERMLSDAPADVDILGRLAELYRRESRWKEAVPVLERLLAVEDAASASVDRCAVTIDLSRALSQSEQDPARAEKLLRELLTSDPELREVAEALGRLLLSRGAWAQADSVLESAGIIERVNGNAVESAVAEQIPPEKALDLDAEQSVATARHRLETGAGDVAAFAVLRPVDLRRLSTEGLVLRAQLAAKLGDSPDLAAILEHWRSHLNSGLDETSKNAGLEILDAALENSTTWETAMSMLENMAEAFSDDRLILDRLAAQYASMDDPRARGRKVDLVTGAAGGHRQLILAEKLASLAESEGDLAAAERHLAAAIAMDVPPEERARCLVHHARVCVALGDVDAATNDFNEVLVHDPRNAPALALLGELSYRAQDWANARRAYAALADSPRHTEVIPNAVLALRRAELAETFGDEVEAESCYRQVISHDPEHGGAREALAQFAAYRGQYAEAAEWLEGALGTVSSGDTERRDTLRERLGLVCLQLQAFERARKYLEPLVVEQPERPTAVEALAQATVGAKDFVRGAELWGRLSRLLKDNRKRAEALYQQGEILRARLGDIDAADDAYLRAADIDPTHVPTLVRLLDHYFRCRDLTNLVELGEELLKIPDGRQTLLTGDAGLVLALGATRMDRENAFPLPDHVSDGAGRFLVDLGNQMPGESPSALDRGIAVYAQILGESAAHAMLRNDAVNILAISPGDRGALSLLARISELSGDVVRARAAYAVLLLREPSSRIRDRLSDLKTKMGRVTDGVLLPSNVLYPVCAGATRRVLTQLSSVLVQLHAEPSEPVEPLDGDVADLVSTLAGRLGYSGLRTGRGGEGSEVRIALGSPPTLTIGGSIELLPAAEMVFFVALALDLLRSATVVVEPLAEGELADLFAGIAAGLRGTEPIASESNAVLRTEVAHLLRDNGKRLPAGVERERLFDDVLEAIDTLPEQSAYVSAAWQNAVRVGAIACGDPVVALQCAAQLAHPGANRITTSMVPVGDAMIVELGRSSGPVGAMASFLLSDEYARMIS